MADLPTLTPAARVGLLSDSYIAARVEEVDQLRHSGFPVVPLGLGSPDKPPHSLVAETLCEQTYREDVHGYQLNPGDHELQRAFAWWYKRHYGVNLDPLSNIATTTGVKDGDLLLSLALLNPGDRVLVPNPGNTAYADMARLAGAIPVEYTMSADTAWQPDLEALDRADLSGVKLMWVCYPNMPTGAPATRELFRRLAAFSCRYGIIIANDAKYSCITPREPLSLLAAEGADPNLLVELNSLSISHNMAGWRMGMIAATAPIVEWVEQVKGAVDAGRPRPLVKASINALRLPPRWYADLNFMYNRRRRIGLQLFSALGCSVDVDNPEGLFLWGRIPTDEPSAEAMCQRLLADHHIFMLPGSAFGTPGSRYIRMALCCPSARMRRAIEYVTGQTAPPLPSPPPDEKPAPKARRKRKRKFNPAKKR